jgi:acyl carrier protein
MDVVYEGLKQIFHDVFDDDTLVITPELTAADVAEWDSLSHIRLMLAVQNSFKIKFSAAQTAGLKNVGQLAELIRAKTATR